MSETYDLLIRGGTLVDGTGAPGRAGDLAIRDGHIAALGSVQGSATREIDATDKVVCPGFVDTRWMAGKLNQAEMAAFRSRAAEIAPLKLLVTPDQVAEAVCWFALGGRALTGQLLVIDGGTHLTVGRPL